MISIIVPTYNEVDVISECLDSLLAQQGCIFEIIVVDGGSSDGTLDLLEKYRKRFNIKVIRESPRISPAHAKNQGLSHATGNIIFFKDADGIIHDPQYFKRIEQAFQNPNVDIARSEVLQNYSRLSRLEKIIWFFEGEYKKAKSYDYAFQKKALEEIEGFDESLGVGEDKDLLRRLTERGYNTASIGTVSISIGRIASLTELATRAFWYGRTFNRFLRKNSSKTLMTKYLGLLTLSASSLGFISNMILTLILGVTINMFLEVLCIVTIIILYAYSIIVKTCRNCGLLAYMLFPFIATFFSWFFLFGIIRSFAPMKHLGR